MTGTNNIIWERTETGLQPVMLGPRGEHTVVNWAPQPGSQQAFLSCPIEECIYEGNRGGGKTDALLMDFAQHVGTGFGEDWNGILFRESYPQLGDVIKKSLKWFSRIFPDAKYNRAATSWTWKTGESLLFRHMAVPADYENYHGHNYQWIGWEELTNWGSSDCYLKMFSTMRSARPDVPRKIRATANPYGIGHGWVKARFRLPLRPGRVVGPVIRDSRAGDGTIEPPRVSIRSMLAENRILLSADPDYITRIRASASSPEQLAAWINGDWDIVSGGMLGDLWDARAHVLRDFPLNLLPGDWKIDRSFDDGQSKPFSVGWWAESNGEPLVLADGRRYGVVRGDLIRVAEWYGSTGEPNKGLRMSYRNIAHGVIEREKKLGIYGRVRPGPADNSIHDPRDPETPSPGVTMAKEGITWTYADKSPGSRKIGWSAIREMLENALQPREKPGLFVLERCHDFIRTMPTLPRDKTKPDDVDTDCEDHIADEVRYRVRARNWQVRSGSF